MPYIVAIATMALMAISVALVLGIVNNLLKVEGEARVKITNDGNELVLPLGQNLMTALKKAGYDLFAQCGGKGTCATCRVKPTGIAADQITAAMLGPLSDKLRKEGWVLSCQVALKHDLQVELFKPLVMAWPPVAGRAEKTEEKQEPKLSPSAAKLRAVLPGFDCHACGYPTCEEFAEALAAGKAQRDGCYPGGRPVWERLGKVAQEAGVQA